MFRNEEVTGSNPVSSTETHGQLPVSAMSASSTPASPMTSSALKRTS